MNAVNIIGGFLSTDTYVAPPKYVEALGAGAEFARLPTLEEVVEKSFQQYVSLVMEREARQIVRDHEIWGRLTKGGTFKVSGISRPVF